SVRVPVVRIMVALAGLPNVRQLRQTQRPASLAEGLERIFGLPRHDDIADQAEEVTFSDRIGEVAGGAHGRADGAFQDACARRAKLALIVLQHALMITHGGYVACAQVAEARV